MSGVKFNTLTDPSIQTRLEAFAQDPDGSQVAVEQQFLVLLIMHYGFAFFKNVEPVEVIVQILGCHAWNPFIQPFNLLW